MGIQRAKTISSFFFALEMPFKKKQIMKHEYHFTSMRKTEKICGRLGVNQIDK